MEIIEDGLMNATALSNAKLQDLKQAGIELAIDDFGTGFSSMAYVHKFDVNYLKIDQSLVSVILSDVNSQTIAETAIVLAHKLGLKVIAEGVETPEQKDWLKTAGSDFAQGFLFSKPVPAEQFIKLLHH